MNQMYLEPPCFLENVLKCTFPCISCQTFLWACLSAGNLFCHGLATRTSFAIRSFLICLKQKKSFISEVKLHLFEKKWQKKIQQYPQTKKAQTEGKPGNQVTKTKQNPPPPSKTKHNSIKPPKQTKTHSKEHPPQKKKNPTTKQQHKSKAKQQQKPQTTKWTWKISPGFKWFSVT